MPETKLKNNFFYTEIGFAVGYWGVLSFALWSDVMLGISVLLSGILLIAWILGPKDRRIQSFQKYKLFIIGQVFYMFGAPFFIDGENIILLKIGTVFFFFSRVFFYFHFRNYFIFYSYFRFKSIVWLLPFLISSCFSFYFLGPSIPDEIFPFVIPLTFLDALMISSIPAFRFGKKSRHLFILGVVFMYLVDHIGGYFIYSHTSAAALFGVRVMSALLKFFLTILVVRIGNRIA